MHNKFLLSVGGWLQQSITSEVYIFRPSNDQWMHLTSVPAAISSPAALGVADNILIIGRANIRNEYSKQVWIGVFE